MGNFNVSTIVHIYVYTAIIRNLKYMEYFLDGKTLKKIIKVKMFLLDL